MKPVLQNITYTCWAFPSKHAHDIPLHRWMWKPIMCTCEAPLTPHPEPRHWQPEPTPQWQVIYPLKALNSGVPGKATLAAQEHVCHQCAIILDLLQVQQGLSTTILHQGTSIAPFCSQPMKCSGRATRGRPAHPQSMGHAIYHLLGVTLHVYPFRSHSSPSLHSLNTPGSHFPSCLQFFPETSLGKSTKLIMDVTAKKNLINCLQLRCSMLQPSCHPNSTCLNMLRNYWPENMYTINHRSVEFFVVGITATGFGSAAPATRVREESPTSSHVRACLERHTPPGGDWSDDSQLRVGVVQPKRGSHVSNPLEQINMDIKFRMREKEAAARKQVIIRIHDRGYRKLLSALTRRSSEKRKIEHFRQRCVSGREREKERERERAGSQGTHENEWGKKKSICP
ncbi:hypothetical protein VP01_843g4 [Puccinia sorghi]|uniref:Uncharacterized protein n=1 Tax=Puccinia sorghi TaxID=27349 RepID=A0A0L6UBE6_9BASI|nr:hypothetical protein VP01_843g4 [Puccinia sorghi]